MGFWSSLANLGKTALNFVPGGGIVNTALDIGGGLLSGGADAAGKNRSEKDLFNQNKDRNTLTARGQDISNEANRADVALKGQTQARNNSEADYMQALRAALAMNMKDASFSRPQGVANISFSGGARPSAMGAQGREAASVMNNLALQRLMNPETQPQIAAVEKFAASEPTKASFWEKLAGPLGAGMTAVASLGQKNSTQGLKATASDYNDDEMHTQ
jgi:hypothetical protein